LIVCMDGLKGFPDAMESIYSEAEVQPCIVHQIRHSLKSVSYKDKKAFMGDLKKVNRAGTKESRELALEALEDKWGGKFFLNWRSFLKEDLIKELKIGQGDNEKKISTSDTKFWTDPFEELRISKAIGLASVSAQAGLPFNCLNLVVYALKRTG